MRQRKFYWKSDPPRTLPSLFCDHCYHRQVPKDLSKPHAKGLLRSFVFYVVILNEVKDDDISLLLVYVVALRASDSRTEVHSPDNP